MHPAIRAIATAAALTAVTSFAQPAKFPSEKVTLVVPYSPGNGLDLLGREFAQSLQTQFGHPVIVENREGAAGAIGTASAARAQPDGYTLLFTAHPPFASTPFAMDKPAYNPATSFVPLARVGSVPLVLVTSSKSPVASFQQMKEFALAHPDKANYASAGVGSPGQLYGELLNQAAGIHLQEVPYKATGQGLTDVISGNVLVSLVSVTAASQHIKGGALRALAVGSKARLAELADVPTLAEVLGQKDFQAGVWYGFFAPAGLAKDKVDKLYAEIAKAQSSQKLTDFMARSSMVPELEDPAVFSKTVSRDIDTARQLVERAKLKTRP